MTDLPAITLAQTGPLIVERPPKLTGAYNLDHSEQHKIALCRCGAFANSPSVAASMSSRCSLVN